MNEVENTNITNKKEFGIFEDESIAKINLKDVLIGEKICKCNYGFVAFCKSIKTNKVYSVKMLKKINLYADKFVEHQYNEYKILSLIYHPFIMELKGINHTDPYYLYYFSELVPGGSLKLYLKMNNVFSLDYAKYYSASIITVLDYLHKKNIIHRNIRAENILVNSNGYIKLSEFTFSKILKKDMTYSLCGSYEYYSPEMINKSGHNKGVDFWQLGLLLYEMLVGNLPFIDNEPLKLFNKIIKGKIRFPKNINENAKSIIKHFLNVDMNKRLGCNKRGIYEIIIHPFFKNFDWEGLLHRKLPPSFIPNIRRLNLNNNYKKIDEILMEDKIEPLPKENDPFYNW